MAALAASAVSITDSWTEGGLNGKRFACVKATLTLTGQGGATNSIAASLFNLRIIEQALPAIGDGNDHIYVASPSYDGTLLLLKASATDAPADITDTVDVIVKGQPADSISS